MMTRPLLMLLSLLCASVTVSSACFAQPNGQVRQVRYGDLDLSTPSGVETLHARIEAAANQVCLDPSGPSPAATVDPACKAEALRAALSQLDLATPTSPAQD
jgi:UrcA family protein